MLVSENSAARLRYLREKLAVEGCLEPRRVPAELVIKRAVILESDCAYGEMLMALIRSVLVSTTVVLTARVNDLDAEVRESGADLLVVNAIAAGGDVMESLSLWQTATGCSILVVVTHPAAALLAAIFEQPVTGIFDRTGGTMLDLQAAIGDVSRGVRYHSPLILERMFSECVAPTSIFASLTRSERMVLGVIGDGCDDTVAADRLSLSRSTIKSVRRQLHQKLSVRHRGELQAQAAALGFVLTTPFGVLRPGLAALIELRTDISLAVGRAKRLA